MLTRSKHATTRDVERATTATTTTTRPTYDAAWDVGDDDDDGGATGVEKTRDGKVRAVRERFGGVRAGDRGERERVGGRASASGDGRRRDERGERGGGGARRRALERADDDGERTTGEASDRCGDADALRRS